jgi:DNA-directed RNA polymerase specialized sigma24 family protein
MITLGSRVEPNSVDAARDDRLVSEYDARFQAARDRLVRLCGGLVGADAAEDVVHDTYMRGRSRFSQFRNLDLFEGWLTRIAVSLCLNRHRRGRRLRDLLVSPPPCLRRGHAAMAERTRTGTRCGIWYLPGCLSPRPAPTSLPG